jgi:hypothetical protein
MPIVELVGLCSALFACCVVLYVTEELENAKRKEDGKERKEEERKGEIDIGAQPWCVYA